MNKCQVILSACLVLSLFGKVYAKAVPVMTAALAGNRLQLKGFMFCLVSTAVDTRKQNLKCRPIKLNQVYNLANRESHNYNLHMEDPARSSESESMDALERLRFNMHVYLDHMWHLNIGFTR